eukprot:COSAG01_NODE_5119_length_4472_cov_20.726961_1_plen_253_part_10
MAIAAVKQMLSPRMSKLNLLEYGVRNGSAVRLLQHLRGELLSDHVAVPSVPPPNTLNMEMAYVDFFGHTDAFTFAVGGEGGDEDIGLLAGDWCVPAQFQQEILSDARFASLDHFDNGYAQFVNTQYACKVCGCFIDETAPASHLTDAHFARHRAFRQAKHTFYNSLCPLLCVLAFIFENETVLRPDEAEQAEMLQEGLLPNNPNLKYWTSDGPTSPYAKEQALIGALRSSFDGVLHSLGAFREGPATLRQYLA